MPEIILMGWDATNKVPVRCKVTAEGKLIINPTGFLENPPTEDQALKAPTSEWAFDHDADPAAHHAKYTAAEARAALGNVINGQGDLIDHLECEWKHLMRIGAARFMANADQDYECRQIHVAGGPNMAYVAQEIGVGYVDFKITKFNTSAYIDMIDQDNFQAELAKYLEESPTNGVVNKGPTSNWAHDHDADPSAHHAKYTDAEAVTAFYDRQTTLTTGIYTNTSMTGINSIFLHTTGGDITLKGLANGSIGQMIFCYRNTSSNNVHVIHASGDAASSDKIYCATGADESIVANHYGGFWLVYTGSFWMIDHTLI